MMKQILDLAVRPRFFHATLMSPVLGAAGKDSRVSSLETRYGHYSPKPNRKTRKQTYRNL
jgi:hypothetical protein